VTVDDTFYHCCAEFSVYQGWKFKGLARTTIIRGEVMMEDYGTGGKPGYGKFFAGAGKETRPLLIVLAAANG